MSVFMIGSVRVYVCMYVCVSDCVCIKSCTGNLKKVEFVVVVVVVGKSM